MAGTGRDATLPPGIFATSYFPPIPYVVKALQCRSVHIDAWETFRKQSFRNRCCILSANGILPLTVPVEHPGRSAKPVRDLRIANRQPWQQRHWQALCSAYNRSAFFEYYRDDLEKIICSKSMFLLDLNMRLLEWLVSLAGLDIHTELTESSQADWGDADYRYLADRKQKVYAAADGSSGQTPYTQVFSSKFGFVPGLSIADLVFNTGTGAARYLC